MKKNICTLLILILLLAACSDNANDQPEFPFLNDFYASGGYARRSSSGDNIQESIRNYYHGIAQTKYGTIGRHYYAGLDVGIATSNTDFIGQ